MRTYVYRRTDGTTFEYKQMPQDEPLKICPRTGQKVHRIIFATPAHFKGKGFYTTDNR